LKRQIRQVLEEDEDPCDGYFVMSIPAVEVVKKQAASVSSTA
jgi:hypothetical protein